MTLIELMVVIVILVTLVAGVLPLVSPNNDARKIAEAARGMQTYFMQAQAEAARLGRPVGVGFRETTAGSGIAIEGFQMVVPAPYTGFGPEARVRILDPFDAVIGPAGTYGTKGELPQGGQLFLELFDGAQLYRLQFRRSPLRVKANGQGLDYAPEEFPAHMLKWGDVVNLEGNEFLIVDVPGNSQLNRLDDDGSDYLEAAEELSCLWLNNFGQQPPEFHKPGTPGTARTYRIFRQPANTTKFGPSSEAAYQFPAGIAIDLQASGLEADDFVLFSTMDTQTEEAAGTRDRLPTGTPQRPRSIAIMFSPNGGIESVWNNGVKLIGTTRAFFMLGRGENGAPPFDLYNFYTQRVGNRDVSDEELREIRTKVNWLNMDSRWLIVNGADGRLTVNQNASFDPRLNDYNLEYQQLWRDFRRLPNYDEELARRGGLKEVEGQFTRQVQIEAAHHFVHGEAEETEP